MLFLAYGDIVSEVFDWHCGWSSPTIRYYLIYDRKRIESESTESCPGYGGRTVGIQPSGVRAISSLQNIVHHLEATHNV